MKSNKGFTLIELLVVIAIIGILSGIVLTSLNSARGKAKDAKIQADLAGARVAAEIFYSDNTPPSYSGLCADLLASAYSKNSDGNVKAGWACGDAPKQYAISATVSKGTYCVDSGGTNEVGTKSADTTGECL